jgi:hypothetical protein
MKNSYMNKNIIFICLICFFILIIALNIYNEYRIVEQFNVRRIGRNIRRTVNKTVNKTTNLAQAAADQAKKQAEAAAAQAKKQAEAAAAQAKKLAESLNIQNALKRLIIPIANLKKNITDTTNFLKDFK